MRKDKKFERVLPLNIDLEKALLYAVIHGEMSLKNVNPQELSKLGKTVYTALAGLVKDGSLNGDGIHARTVWLAATEVHDAGPEVKDYIKEIENGEIPEIQSIHGALARKRIISSLVNEASDQVASGDYSILALKGLIDEHTHKRNTLVALQHEMGKDVSPPKGIPIPCLSKVTEATGGLFGVWLIGGEPAAGKSTLALQIALSVGRRRPVLYYDFEQGTSVIKWHVHKALEGDRDKIDEATKQLYIRTSVGSMEADLDMLSEPCLVVVDSIQKIASSVTYRRESLEQWVHKLEALKKYGHHVILVSEKNRGSYGGASLQGYKETGELEYAADTAFDMIKPDEEDGSRTDLHITKNRHYPKRGYVTTLKRRNSWWFDEEGTSNRREVD
jgi:AAA domain-containing protein